MLSWHGLEELRDCLHLVQAYIDALGSKHDSSHKNTASDIANGNLNGSRKRKRGVDQEGLSSRDVLGFPKLLSQRERSWSSSSRSPSVQAGAARNADSHNLIAVYNGVLIRKNGEIAVLKVSSLPFSAAATLLQPRHCQLR